MKNLMPGGSLCKPSCIYSIREEVISLLNRIISINDIEEWFAGIDAFISL